MPKIRNLSGKDVVGIFKRFDFSVKAQKGSHIKLGRRVSAHNQTLTIPNHKELDIGTVKAIYNQALHYIHEDKLKNYFYTE